MSPSITVPAFSLTLQLDVSRTGGNPCGGGHSEASTMLPPLPGNPEPCVLLTPSTMASSTHGRG